MAKQFFKDLPDTSTPLTASRLNGLLDGEEAMGNLVVDSIRSKNIFGNYTIVNGYLFETRMSIRNVASDRLAFIECKPNTTYTISRSVITSSFRVSDYTSIPQMTDSYVDYTVPTVVENNSGTTMTYTTSSTAKYLVIHYGNALNDTATNLTNTLKTMQVEEGTEATTYSPYFSPANEMSDKLSQIAFKTTNTQFTINQYSGINLNNLADQLGVSFIYGTSLTNAPVGALGYIITICILDPAYAKQYFMAPWSGSPEIYTRTKDNGTWSSWYKINVVAL